MNNQLGNGAPIREPIYHELIQMAMDLVAYSSEVADLTQGTLEKVQVLQPATNPDPVPSKEPCLVSWPQLYDEIRGHLLKIRRNVSRVEDSVKRAEL
jgi:hypothetical protein